jgi:hypothetical protein
MPIQIRQRVQWTGRAHPVVVLPWGLPWFPGVAETKLCGLEYRKSRAYSVWFLSETELERCVGLLCAES